MTYYSNVLLDKVIGWYLLTTVVNITNSGIRTLGISDM